MAKRQAAKPRAKPRPKSAAMKTPPAIEQVLISWPGGPLQPAVATVAFVDTATTPGDVEVVETRRRQYSLSVDDARRPAIAVAVESLAKLLQQQLIE